MTRQLLDMFFGRQIRRQTTRYLEELASAPIRSTRQNAATFLKALAATGGPMVTLGRTTWGETVAMPVSEMIASHGLITGGSGAGKTFFSLLILQALVDQLPQSQSFGFGLIDPKGELFQGALYLLARRLTELEASDPVAADALRRRVVIVDFSTSDPVSAYNVLARGSGVEPGFFADGRADLLSDLLPGTDTFTVNGNAVLRKVIRLLVESELPITRLDDVLHDSEFRAQLLSRSGDTALRLYFERQYSSVPKQTLAALSRRVETLFSSQGVRLALSGTTAPNLTTIQDDSRVLLVNCAGQNLSRSVRQLLQALVLSDVRQAVFARQRRDKRFLFMLDESQHFFANERLRDHMGELLSMARSFGTFFLCLTQNVTTAVHDPRLLSNLYTNAKWTFSLRGQPSDNTFLKPALPITGRKSRPQTNPFEEPGFYSINEERALELDAIASLPDRTGFFWPRSLSTEAIKITTESLAIPHGEALERAIEPLRADPAIGERMSRQAYEAELTLRDEPMRETPPMTDLADALAGAYKRRRGDGR